RICRTARPSGAARGGSQTGLCLLPKSRADLFCSRHGRWQDRGSGRGRKRRFCRNTGGDGFRVEVEALQKILESAPHLQLLLSRFAVVQGMQVAQTAACNRLHEIEQRLARWLLIAQDRVDSGVLPITHDFLATMLGTNRSSVSLAAAALRKKNLIRYTPGAVTIVNRKKLEALACECYGIMQQHNGHLGLR